MADVLPQWRSLRLLDLNLELVNPPLGGGGGWGDGVNFPPLLKNKKDV